MSGAALLDVSGAELLDVSGAELLDVSGLMPRCVGCALPLPQGHSCQQAATNAVDLHPQDMRAHLDSRARVTRVAMTVPVSAALQTCFQYLDLASSSCTATACWPMLMQRCLPSSPPDAALPALLPTCRLLHLLEWEGEAPVGGKAYSPEVEDPSEAGALAATLWELALLQRHYHPHVGQAAASVAALAPGDTPAGCCPDCGLRAVGCGPCMPPALHCLHATGRHQLEGPAAVLARWAVISGPRTGADARRCHVCCRRQEAGPGPAAGDRPPGVGTPPQGSGSGV